MILHFQLRHIISCLTVLEVECRSNDNEDIVSVFLTRTSMRSPRSMSRWRSSFMIWFTYSVSFQSRATLSTSSGVL